VFKDFARKLPDSASTLATLVAVDIIGPIAAADSPSSGSGGVGLTLDSGSVRLHVIEITWGLCG
jgi:hypothetical protein